MNSQGNQSRKAPSLISKSSLKPQLSQNSTNVTSTNTLSAISTSNQASRSTSRSSSPAPSPSSVSAQPQPTNPSISTSNSFSTSNPHTSCNNHPEAESNLNQEHSILTASLVLPPASSSQIAISSQSDQDPRDSINITDHDADDEEESISFNSHSTSNALALLRSVSFASQLSGNESKGKDKERHGEESINDLEETVSDLDAPSSSSRRGRSSSRSIKESSGPVSISESDSEDSETSDPDPFPLPRYYVLTAAGKPVYVSRGAEGRLKKKKKKKRSKGQKEEKAETEVSRETTAQRKGEFQDEGEGDGHSTSDSEEERSTTRVGVMSALISIFQTDESAPGGGDKIRQIKTSSSSSTTSPINLTFLHRPPLHLVCISTSAHTLPYHTTIQILQTLHSYLLSLLTSTQLTNIFSKRSNFDLRRLLGGTDRLLDSICKKMTLEIGGILGALQPLTLSGSLRDELGTCLRFKSVNGDGKPPPQTLLVLLLEKGKLVTILRPKMTSLHPKDMEILMHTARVATGGSRKLRRSSLNTQPQAAEQVEEIEEDEDTEVWAPICLPKFEHRGFLHMYVSGLRSKSLDSEPGKEKRKAKSKKASEYKPKLQLIFVTADREAFPALSSWKKDIEKSLHSPPSSTPIASLSTSPSIFSLLLKQLPNSTFSVDDLRIAGLRHFVFKSTAHTQITGPRWEGAYGWEGKENEEGKDLEAWEYDLDEEIEINQEDDNHNSNLDEIKETIEKEKKLRKDRKEKLINRKRLITLYLLANDSIHAPNRCRTPSTNSLFNSIYQNQQTENEYQSGNQNSKSNSTNPSSSFRPPVPGPLKLQYLKTQHESVLVWLTQSFELYITLSPWMSKSAAVKSANECAKWCSEKENELWISRSQVF